MKSPECALYNMAGRVVHARILVIVFITASTQREEMLRRRIVLVRYRNAKTSDNVPANAKLFIEVAQLC